MHVPIACNSSRFGETEVPRRVDKKCGRGHALDRRNSKTCPTAIQFNLKAVLLNRKFKTQTELDSIKLQINEK